MSQHSMTVAVLGKGRDYLIRDGPRGRFQGESRTLSYTLKDNTKFE